MSSEPLVIAITGAAGHVGTTLVRHALSQGHTVVGIDVTRKISIDHQERYTYKQVNTTDFEAYRNAVGGCNAIIHLAMNMSAMRDEEGNRVRQSAQHEIHNNSVAMSFNALSIAEELGINRVVLASSVNSIGMIHSIRPRFDYLPLTEEHTFRPEDAYSLAKYFVELQADAFARKNPSMRIATLRFHWVVPDENVTIQGLSGRDGWKDLWGFVSVSAVAEACLKALTVDEKVFPVGHETFFIVATTTSEQQDSYELLQTKFPEIKDLRADFKGSNRGFFDCSKAEKMLGWKEEGIWWHEVRLRVAGRSFSRDRQEL